MGAADGDETATRWVQRGVAETPSGRGGGVGRGRAQRGGVETTTRRAQRGVAEGR